MSLRRPRTLPEWAGYIATLSGEALSSKARAANSIDFAARLQDEGLSPDEVETLYVLLAKQMKRAGVRLTDDGLYSYARLAERDPPLPIALPEPADPIVEDVDDDYDD